jgi:uncharacterized protein YaiI (UPF0178 family)
MRIWVDADACPMAIKEMLFRAAERRKVRVTLVANQSMRIPRSEFIDTLLVPSGMNVADRKIVELVTPGDLVVTADVPLAGEVVNRGAAALDPRGTLYSDANIGERLAVRNLLDGFRGEGHVIRGPANFNDRDKRAFADQLDRWLTKRAASTPAATPPVPPAPAPSEATAHPAINPAITPPSDLPSGAPPEPADP